MALVHFLLVYNISEQRLIERREFADSNEAISAYAEIEAAHRSDKEVEIVLVGADSIETIMQTHGHYFGRLPKPAESPYLAGVR